MANEVGIAQVWNLAALRRPNCSLWDGHMGAHRHKSVGTRRPRGWEPRSRPAENHAPCTL